MGLVAREGSVEQPYHSYLRQAAWRPTRLLETDTADMASCIGFEQGCAFISSFMYAPPEGIQNPAMLPRKKIRARDLRHPP